MYADELRSMFCEVAGISSLELATEQWASRLGIIFSEIGQPLAKVIQRRRDQGRSKGPSITFVRAWVAKLCKRLETDADERERIAQLKTALAERVYEIQTAKAAGVTKSRVAVAAQVRARVCRAAHESSAVTLSGS